MATVVKDLGAVTAYAYAVAGGYSGTEAEFEALLGNIAEDLSEIENLSVTVTTLPAGSYATASYSNGVLSLGIPKGDKGDKGNTGDTGATGPQGLPGDVANLAAAYSDSSTYNVGDYCIYNNQLYRCTTAITTAEEWTAAHWKQIALGDDVSNLKSALGLSGIEQMPYAKTGTGNIADNGVVTYSSPGSGYNYMMLIDDADTITGIKHIKAYLGNNGYKYGIAFADANGSLISGAYGEFPNTTATAQTIDVDVPSGTAKIYLYNRYSVLETPTITIVTNDGYEARIENVENSLSSLTPIVAEIPTIETEIDKIDAIISNSYRSVQLSSLEFFSNGFINNNGVPTSTSSTSHKIMMMDASNVSAVRFEAATALISSLAFGVLKDSGDNIIKTLYAPSTTDPVEWTFTPQAGNKLYISWYNYATAPNPYYSSFGVKNYESIVDAYRDELAGFSAGKYMSCVKKPFDFTGKSCIFFGDSITWGYIAQSGSTPSHQATNQYPKLFAQGVGATYDNQAVSGSTLAEVSGLDCIADKIESATLTGADFVFVSGGVNDWQTGVNEATLITAVTGICEYLKTNFSGEVIWITPINEAGRDPITPPTQTLQNVRNIITRIALKYGYSVVQGWEFPFPTVDDDADYVDEMFQDKLHPTELGYSMYAHALRSALC